MENEKQNLVRCSSCGATNIPLLNSPNIKLCLRCLSQFNMAAFNALLMHEKMYTEREQAEAKKRVENPGTGTPQAGLRPDAVPEPEPDPDLISQHRFHRRHIIFCLIAK